MPSAPRHMAIIWLTNNDQRNYDFGDDGRD
jgi:hypothetical protein